MASGENVKTHNLDIKNRKVTSLTGVEKVKNINSSTFEGKVAGYHITIQGDGLELTKLDLDKGEVEISGTVNSLKYSGTSEKVSLFKRIFK